MTSAIQYIKIIHIVLLASPLVVFGKDAEHSHEIEEIVVTAAFQKSAAETGLPVTVLGGEKLLDKVANSLGETLKDEIGISSASFGPGIGHPVIRGQTGNRVSVLQNGVGVTDASNQSPDHAEGVEAILAERIEVLRGPSTLLYGSGAVGGVVNVIDSRIPATNPEKTTFIFEQTRNTNNDENKSVFRVDTSFDRLAFHIDGYSRRNENVSIEGFAIDEAAVEALDELFHAEEDHEDEHEDEAFENSNGYIDNSEGEASGGSVGFSFVGDRGFLGFSASRLTNEYGLPPGTHAHHEEHENEHGYERKGHEDVEFVRIDMEKTRYDLRGMLEFEEGWVQSIRASLGYSDYKHDELEIFVDGEQEVGTRFSSNGIEGRFVINRRTTGNWSGVYGLQFTETEFSAIGEEAFIPRSDISNYGFFGVERYQNDKVSLELGARLDRNEVNPSHCASNENAFSLSGSLLYDVSESSNLLVGISRSERTPSVEELFSNIANTCARPADNESLVAHAATALLEIGNPALDNEAAHNIELGYRFAIDSVSGEVSVYHNRINDYIFLDLTGEEVDEQLVAHYLAKDATFSGLEAKLVVGLIEENDYGLDWSLFGDVVHADFDEDGNVPRIPPAKIGMELELYGDNWTFHLHTTRFMDQDSVGEYELATAGYTSVSIHADYHWAVGNDAELKLFARGNNLLDEEIRNHASFIKNFAPDTGRGVVIGLRLTY